MIDLTIQLTIHSAGIQLRPEAAGREWIVSLAHSPRDGRAGRIKRCVDSNFGHRINLKQYRRLNGKWQFVPVVKQNGKPNPKLVLINGEPVSSKGGIFYLDWREDAKRLTRPVGNSPREALDAWQLECGLRTGYIEPEDERAQNGTEVSIDKAIEKYLIDIKATKGARTYKEYSRHLLWF